MKTFRQARSHGASAALAPPDAANSVTPVSTVTRMVEEYHLTHNSESDITGSDHGRRLKPIPSTLRRHASRFARSCWRGPSWLRNHAGGRSAVGGAIQAGPRNPLRQPAEDDEPGDGGRGALPIGQ